MDFGQWRGLFEWSMKYQDGTKPTEYNGSSLTPEKKQWLEEALKSFMQDFAVRMREIKDQLDGRTPATVEEKEAMLEELMDITCSIDHARDLHKIGGLPTLLELLSSPHPGLRWRAAEVVATCASNNTPVQQWFLEGGALPRLMALAADDDTTCRSKALLALSGLLRHFLPGIAAFRQQGGLQLLVGLLDSADPRLRRKAMSTLDYYLSTVPADSPGACRLGALPTLTRALSSDDAPVREATLQLLVRLASDTTAGRLLQQEAALPEALHMLQQHHQHLPQEDREACEEELALTQRLLAILQELLLSDATGFHSAAQEGRVAAAGGSARHAVSQEVAVQRAAEQQEQDRKQGLVLVTSPTGSGNPAGVSDTSRAGARAGLGILGGRAVGPE